MGNGKNIRTRRKIRAALPGMLGRFSTHDMSAATGLSPGRVVGLLKGMDGVIMIRVGDRKVVWEAVKVG